mmetsp:Transcript_31112/g.93416  ORF Transcript_31112/g.93416 Transcript_31112/m.93416 type:complete len:130 (-) Transcript_31112:202-591(-)
MDLRSGRSTRGENRVVRQTDDTSGARRSARRSSTAARDSPVVARRPRSESNASSVASSLDERDVKDELEREEQEVLDMRSVSGGRAGPAPLDVILGGIPRVVKAVVGHLVASVDGWGVDEAGEMIRVSL